MAEICFIWDNSAVFNTIIAFLYGAIFGSFLNMLLWRLPREEGIGGHSRCPDCGHTLTWLDLVPILSFIFLKGRCRYCRKKINKRYLVVEVASGLVLAFYFYLWRPAFGIEAVLTIFALLILLGLFFFDLYYLALPDIFIYLGILVYGVFDFFRPDFSTYLLTALLCASFFAILYTASRGKQLGFGDIKLAFLIGLILGYPMAPAAIVSGIWFGTIIAIILLLSGKKGRRDPIPLGSFLTLATIVFLLYYHEIIPHLVLFR